MMTPSSVIRYHSLAAAVGSLSAGRDVDALRLVANAYKQRSLKDFQETVNSYSAEISNDFFIQNHLQVLMTTNDDAITLLI